MTAAMTCASFGDGREFQVFLERPFRVGNMGVPYHIRDMPNKLLKFSRTMGGVRFLNMEIEVYERFKEVVPATHLCHATITDISSPNQVPTQDEPFTVLLKELIVGEDLGSAVMAVALGENNVKAAIESETVSAPDECDLPNAEPPSIGFLKKTLAVAGGTAQLNSDLHKSFRCIFALAAAINNEKEEFTSSRLAWEDLRPENMIWGREASKPNSSPRVWVIDSMITKYSNKDNAWVQSCNYGHEFPYYPPHTGRESVCRGGDWVVFPDQNIDNEDDPIPPGKLLSASMFEEILYTWGGEDCEFE